MPQLVDGPVVDRALAFGLARHDGAFYGWWMVLVCTIARGFTAPGQTIGVSAFIDDLIESLGTTRSAVSTAYLVGTLTGATALAFVGRWIDRVGVRHTMTVMVSAFAVVIALTGTVQNVVMLAVAFVGLRMLGQGSLTLISTTGVVVWFENRRGLALALTGMGGAALLSLAPLTFTQIINAVGWRWAWVVLGVAVAVVVVPLGRFAVVDRPEELGQVPDGRRADQPELLERGPSSTVAQAIRTPAFWTLTTLSMLIGAISTGLTFHNTDLLGAQGLSKEQASAVFIPQLVGSVSMSFAFGWMTDHVKARPLMFFGGMALAAAAFLATIAEPGLLAAAYGLTMGVAMGSIFGVSSALYPKWFGIDHIGSIKGIATTANVAASAVGPLILSIGNDVADSYRPVVLGCATVSAVLALAGLTVPTPDRP